MFLIQLVLDFLILLAFVLVNIAFITLLERKILGYSQSRVGPNKPSFTGILQPMADAVKLFMKNFMVSNKMMKLVFYFMPNMSLILVLWVWMIIPTEFGISTFLFSSILLLMILSLNVYPLMLSGWASKNKYSMMGSLRSIAQTISYEISLAMILLIILVYFFCTSFDFCMKYKFYNMMFLVNPVVFVVWLISSLAETNRTPFDFSEGESELVSGFNTEYSAGGFAMIFMAEYGSIYFLSMLTSLIFCLISNYLMTTITASLLVFIWVWTRTTFPRYRYDLLMSLAWKSILPIVLFTLVFLISLLTLYIKISFFNNK